MIKLLASLKTYIKLQDIVTDNAVFRLHNSFTTALLLACSLIITATQYVGRPIDCIMTGLPTHVVNTFCWISSTFTMPDAFRRQVGKEVAHPGIANDFNEEGAKKYYTYYQWVCFVLFFQAMACYTPKFLWEKFEGGLMRTIVMGLNNTICSREDKDAKREALMDYLTKHVRRHKAYAVRYFCCEVLCLINIIAQMYLMNRFFDGEFLSYGLRIMELSDIPQEDRVDPMVYVFPRVTKCIFHKYGPSGSLQKHDSLCILPLNIVNEKTYVFIWFWFNILLVLLIGLMIFRAIILFMPQFRPRLLNARNRMIPIEICRALSRKLDIGDWWLIYMLGQNLDPGVFKDVVSEFAKQVEPARDYHRSSK